MKIVTKDGVCFVIDLVWQKDSPDNRINIPKIKKAFDFALYTKTNVIDPSYCFVPNSHELQKLIVNKTQLNSLTVFVLESLKEVFSGMIEDSFICFKIDEANFGVIFIYKGGVIANDGELIGGPEEIKEFILKNAYRYNVLVAHILADVNFLADNDFLSKNGIELVKHDSPNNEKPSSDYYLWEKDDRFKIALKKASLRTLDFFQEDQKEIAKKAGLVIVGIFIFLSMVFGIKSCFFGPKPVVVKKVIKVTPKFVVPIDNKRGVEAKLLMHECFSSLKDLPKYLEIQEVNCNLKNLQVNFAIHDYDNAKATEFVRGLFPKNTSINLIESGGVSSINLVVPMNLSQTPPQKLHDSQLMEKIRLRKLGLVHSMDIAFDKSEIEESVAVEIPPTLDASGKQIESAPVFKLVPKKVMINVVTIVSPYSPFYLHKNSALDRINVYNIYMKINPDGTAVWIIKGEFSGD